jgi:uncharacterized protein
MPVSLSELRAKREQILQLASQYRVRNVRVFGSVVRDDLEPWSDVDFMVEPLPGHSLLDRAGLVLALRELLDTQVDVVTERELRDYVRAEAAREAIAL